LRKAATPKKKEFGTRKADAVAVEKRHPRL